VAADDASGVGAEVGDVEGAPALVAVGVGEEAGCVAAAGVAGDVDAGAAELTVPTCQHSMRRVWRWAQQSRRAVAHMSRHNARPPHVVLQEAPKAPTHIASPAAWSACARTPSAKRRTHHAWSIMSWHAMPRRHPFGAFGQRHELWFAKCYPHAEEHKAFPGRIC